MPVSNNPSSSSRVFIWIITIILFVCIASGGICLLAYMKLPESPTTHWLPVIGLSLVCLPWFFWFLTCVYRLISRKFGFRMVMGGGASSSSCGGGGGGGGDLVAKSTNGDADDAQIDVNPAPSPPHSDGKRVQFGSAVVIAEDDRKDKNNQDHHLDIQVNKLQSSSSSISSVGSHESEKPLASSRLS